MALELPDRAELLAPGDFVLPGLPPVAFDPVASDPLDLVPAAWVVPRLDLACLGEPCCEPAAEGAFLPLAGTDLAVAGSEPSPVRAPAFLAGAFGAFSAGALSAEAFAAEPFAAAFWLPDFEAPLRD